LPKTLSKPLPASAFFYLLLTKSKASDTKMEKAPLFTLKKWFYHLVPSKTVTVDFSSIADGEAFLPIPFKRNTEKTQSNKTADMAQGMASVISQVRQPSAHIPSQVTLDHPTNPNAPTSHFTRKC
jgi:hypothetical protein